MLQVSDCQASQDDHGSKDGAVVRAHASHQCVLGSIPRPGIICGLSLLLVLFLDLRGFSLGTPVFLDFLKSPSSCLFSARRTKDFSYLIAAKFSDPKTGRCASTNQSSPGYPMGTELSNYAQRNVTCG